MPAEIAVYMVLSVCAGLALGAPAYFWFIASRFNQRLVRCWNAAMIVENELRQLEQAVRALAHVNDLFFEQEHQRSRLIGALVHSRLAVRVESAHLSHHSLLRRLRKFHWTPFGLAGENELRALTTATLLRVETILSQAHNQLERGIP
jgi:hypothetical protein